MNDASRLPQARLLSWICDKPAIYGIVKQYISPDDFADPLYRKVANILFAQLDKNSPNPADIISMFDDEEDQRRVAEAFHQNVGDLDSVEMKKGALKDLMINIKRLSVTRDDREDNSFDTIKKLRKELEDLQKASIDISEIG